MQLRNPVSGPDVYVELILGRGTGGYEPALDPVAAAISAEVIGTSCLRLSEMTRPLPTLLVFGAYAIAMALLSKVVLAFPWSHLRAVERHRHRGDRAGGPFRLRPDAWSDPVDRDRTDHRRRGAGE